MSSVIVIGAGFSGVAAAIELIRAGHDVTVLERGPEVGGVWRENTYPGAACDVPSAYYSFSYAPSPHWSRVYAGQAEILDYLRDNADRFGVYRRIRFGADVRRAEFDETDNRWITTLDDGTSVTSDFLVPAVGQLSTPVLADLPGGESFAGEQFHSAQWDHTVDVTGKHVAVIGTGASSIQIVPKIAGRAASVTVYQRSAPHLLPRPDFRLTRAHAVLARRAPVVLRAQRRLWQGITEGFTAALHDAPRAREAVERFSLGFMRLQARDAGLFATIKPDHDLGCKRVLFSNTYIPALRRPDVHVVTGMIAAVDTAAITTDDGRRRHADVIVHGTGFAAGGFLDHVEVRGTGGAVLSEAWTDGPRAYLGMSVPRFPNMFLMYGPNTNLGSGSIVAMLECQAGYIRQAVDAVPDGAAATVRPEVETAYDDGLQARLEGGVWSRCDSWYRTEAGRVVSNWPGLVREYRRRTATFDARDYDVRPPLPAPSGTVGLAGTV
ncbi:NAD(P)/FAD-dependent oxidoreductase [Tsukamurella sp. 1534]|uniref:flavin-containing monooxygenase n=1 Tax=Tsukamurella sp. 1534 TaxID=1151061 RepID=UPI0002F7B687|nr:NAD(P)/FAD-dependent oxidoreductase [Tsukamurella sp. 1534]